jgi:hypothetical protein
MSSKRVDEADTMPLWSALRRYRFGLTVFACAVVAFAAILVTREATNPFTDLKALYCAGAAFAHGADPYRDVSLRFCERALDAHVLPPSAGFDQPTIPAPWPPYAMPLLALVGSVPFGVAVIGWTAINFAALALAAELLRRRLTRVSPVAIAVLVLFAGVPTEAVLGQPVGIELLAVTAAGWFVVRASSIGIACALIAAAIQPYVALPLVVSLCVAGPAARRGAAAGVAALGALSLLLWPRTLEYLTVVAPSHGRINLLEITQLSVTSLLAASGMAAQPAIAIGAVVYAAAICAGTWAGVRLAVGERQPEARVWIPVMLGTFAAPYLHFQQLACAVPGALLLMDVAAVRRLARGAAVVLFDPWIGLLIATTYGYAIAPFAALGMWGAVRGRLVRVGICAVALLVIELALAGFFRAHLHNPDAYRAAALPADATADESWRGFVALSWGAMGVASLPPRLLTAASELVLSACVLVGAMRAESVPPGRPARSR